MKLTCHEIIYISEHQSSVAALTANGPAVEGVNVTRREHRPGPGTLARKLSRCKEDMACVFAVRQSILLSFISVAVQAVSEPKIVMVQDLIYEQVRMSGFSFHYKFVLGAGAKAKIVTTCPAKRETTYLYCPCYTP